MPQVPNKRKAHPRTDVWKGCPETIRSFANGRSNVIPFWHEQGPSECWAWVLDMSSSLKVEDMTRYPFWQPIRVGADLHMIHGEVIWGNA